MPNWGDWFAAAGVRDADVRRGLRFNSADHALDATVEGAGVLLAHDVLAYDDLRTGRLVMPFALTLPSRRCYCFVCPKKRREFGGCGGLPRLAQERGWRPRLEQVRDAAAQSRPAGSVRGALNCKRERSAALEFTLSRLVFVLFNAKIAAPAFGRQPLDRGAVVVCRENPRFGIVQGVEQLRAEHRAHGVYGFVTIQAFRHQPVDAAPNRQFIAHRDLVFDRGVDGGVNVLVRQGNAAPPVVVQHLVQAFLFVQSQPFRRIGSGVGIIGALDVEVLVLLDAGAVFLVTQLFQIIECVFRDAKLKAVGAQASAQVVDPTPDLGRRVAGPGT